MNVEVSVQSCKSAERVLEVLALFRERKRPMRASYISTELDYPLSSCVVLLKAIVRMGYLSFNPDTHAFFPTAGLYHLGSWLMNERLADPELVDIAHAVHGRTGNSVTFSIRCESDLEFVYSLNAGLPLNAVYAGAKIPLRASVAGVAYLSGLGDADAARIIDALLARAANGPDARSALRARVQKARQVGYACGPSPHFPGLLAFAKCIRHRMTGRPLVVCVGSDTRDLAEFESETRERLGRNLEAYLAR